MSKNDKKNKENINEYSASSIEILEGLEAVRKKPGMYIDSVTMKGAYHLIWEIIDNSIDEALAGYATEIILKIFPNNVVSVSDNGRGIPVDIHPKTNKSAVETILTTLHAGGKFKNTPNSKNYSYSGGQHGVGASVVNALSNWFIVEIFLNGKIYYQKYEKGVPTSSLQIVGDTDKRGTTITFLPDETIFQDIKDTPYSLDVLKKRIQQLAFLNKNVKLILEDLRFQPSQIINFYSKGGIQEYLQYLNENKKVLNQPFYQESSENNIFLEIAFQYNENYISNIYSFVNNIPTHEGGTHEEGFKMALNRVLSKYAKDKNLLKKDFSFIGEDTLEGITAIIALKHYDPLFEGQTKARLGNYDIRQFVSKNFGLALENYLLENPQEAKKIIDKCLLAAKARVAAKKAREITRKKSPLDNLSFASKLADCRTKNSALAELYIVEGDSAGGSAKQGRDSAFQAILPLRGKIINVEKARLNKILVNNEILSLIQSFGTGFDKEFNISKARYHKIIIMTDADVDGAHIRTLLLTFLFRQFKPLIENNYIYFAKPPLYKVQNNKKIFYFYTEQELKNFINRKNDSQRIVVQRYKGLGEMNAEQLWETTMDPATRTLLQVKLEDAVEADRIFTMLMGEEVSNRKIFIQENATYADIDI
ncbi:DNA topoisomerase subunit B [Candidatus Phytoplasma gossypii]|uniref:DNA topoisomerase (ATP-hydrolyzing) n=1 Tax=Candidatus Phytoplasma gossypii TaxID=2982629 RepID=A0ABT9D3Z0_9MOLU|nr:DNA topoisomerase subunit B ['Gossypium sp.' phytoplasma]MDO8057442.1 type IIA DNA topoisomerase subunit B ['Gossypium sp.' phytoplasma]